jgi:hypothetical protein
MEASCSHHRDLSFIGSSWGLIGPPAVTLPVTAATRLLIVIRTRGEPLRGSSMSVYIGRHRGDMPGCPGHAGVGAYPITGLTGSSVMGQLHGLL